VKSSLQKLYSRHHEVADRYEISISRMTMDLWPFMLFFCLSSNTDKTFTVLDYMSNWADVLLCETGTAYPSLAPGFTASFFGGTVLLIFLFFNVL
jgi:hypothetical protein